MADLQMTKKCFVDSQMFLIVFVFFFFTDTMNRALHIHAHKHPAKLLPVYKVIATIVQV